MRFRMGMLVGAAAGYVLGARAGRERYEQLKHLAAEAGKHPAIAQLMNHAGGLVDAGRYSAAAGLSTGAKGLRAIDTESESDYKNPIVNLTRPTGTIPR